MAARSRITLEIVGDASKLSRSFNQASRSAQTFNGKITRASRGITRALGFTGAIAGVGALGLALRSITNASIDFESSFAGVRKTVDGTEPQLQKLALGFRAMSREIPVSVNELNRIGEAAGQLGVKRSAIQDFTKTIAAMTVATNLSADEASNSFARLANITGLPQDQFDRLGSTVVELGNKLAATESEIVEFGLRIAGAGRQVGLTEAQILGIGGAFASVGVEAEAGGTAVSKVLAGLQSAVLSGGKELKAFANVAGTSAAEFAKAFRKDAGAAFVQFVQGLEAVRKEGGNTFQVLKDLGLSDQRLIRAFTSISAAGNLLPRSLNLASAAFQKNVALTEEAEKRYATTASKLQVFRNRLNDLQIMLGDVLAPALLDIINPLGEWLEQTENQKRAQKELTTALGDAKDIIQGVAGVVVPLAQSLRALADNTVGLKEAVKLLVTVMVASKVVGFATSITGLGTAAVGSTTKVNLLRTALLRLGAIGVITLGVEIFLHRGELDRLGKRVHDAVRDKIGGLAGGTELEIPLNISLDKLIEIRAAFARIKGEGSLAVKTLDELIRKKFQLEKTAPRRGEERLGTRPFSGKTVSEKTAEKASKSERDAAKRAATLREKSAKEAAVAADRAQRAKEKAQAAFDGLMDAFSLDLERAQSTKNLGDDLRVLADTETAIKKRIAAEGKTVELERRLFEIQRERADIRQRQQEELASQRQRRQLRLLGLDASGGDLAPSIGTLRKRFAAIGDAIKGTFLDTNKTRSLMQNVRNLLRGQLGKLGEDMRRKLKEILGDLNQQLKDASREGPKTEFAKRGVEALAAGLGLTPEQIKELRQRFARLGPGGSAPKKGIGAFELAIPTTSAGGGNLIININGDIRTESPDAFIREIQKRADRRSGSRRGTRAGAKR